MQSKHFQTTCWSLVERARDGTDQAAMDELLKRLRSPIYWWLRRYGRSHADADDLTQGYIMTVVLRRQLLEGADPSGRLRSLVLSSLKRYLIDQHRHDTAQVRCPRGEHRTDDHMAWAADNAPDADHDFDREWHCAALDAALVRTRERLDSSRQRGHWEAFERYVLRPSLSGVQPPSMSDIAVACGFSSAASASASVRHVRKMVLTTLREVIGETAHPGDAEAEYQHLLASLS